MRMRSRHRPPNLQADNALNQKPLFDGYHWTVEQDELMPDWVLPLLSLIAILAFLYRAFCFKPMAPPSGKEHEADATIDLWRATSGLDRDTPRD